MSDKDAVQGRDEPVSSQFQSSPLLEHQQNHDDTATSTNGKLQPNTSKVRSPLVPSQIQNGSSKIPALSIHIPKSTANEHFSNYEYVPISHLGSKTANGSIVYSSNFKEKPHRAVSSGTFELSPPNTAVFHSSLVSPPKRTNSTGSNKSHSISPLRRNSSIKSTSSSTSTSPVLHSVTCLPSPVVFDPSVGHGFGAFPKTSYYKTLPSSWAKTTNEEGEGNTGAGGSVMTPKQIQPFKLRGILRGNNNKSDTKIRQFSANHFDKHDFASQPNNEQISNDEKPIQEQILPTLINNQYDHYDHRHIVKKDLPVDRIKDNDTSELQHPAAQQKKRIFSTPLPQDSNLISTMLNNDSEIASGKINESVIKREHHNDVNTIGLRLRKNSKEDVLVEVSSQSQQQPYHHPLQQQQRQRRLSNKNQPCFSILESLQETQTEKQPTELKKCDPIIEKYDKIYNGYDRNGTSCKWKFQRILGKGSFSTVVLGQLVDQDNDVQMVFGSDNHRETRPVSSVNLVAIKITDFPTSNRPQGQGNKARIESSLYRELEILTACDHPCIIKVVGKGVSDEHNNITMLRYCRGGDLFELASKYRSQIRPFLLQRMFSEIVAAVNYLHKHYIVHRDVKLENVLINFKTEKLLAYKESNLIPRKNHDGNMIEDPIITLTDFGLSKQVDPEDVMLETRCGSEDYVAPELLMGSKYDGRQTDTWALGVLLYALMEGRLPFDPPPPTINPITGAIRNSRVRSRTAHRIARIEWAWYFFKDENSNRNKSNSSSSSSDESPIRNEAPTNRIIKDSASQIEEGGRTTSSGLTIDMVPNSPVINHYQYRYDSGLWEGAKNIVKNTLIKRDKRWTCEDVLNSNWCSEALPESLKL